MKRIKDYLKDRTVQLGAIGALVVVFAGLPAYGDLAGTDNFKKLDAIGWAADVLLAEGHDFAPPPPPPAEEPPPPPPAEEPPPSGTTTGDPNYQPPAAGSDPYYNDPNYNDPNYQPPAGSDPYYNDPNYNDPNYQPPAGSDPYYNDPNYQPPADGSDPYYNDPNYNDPNYQPPAAGSDPYYNDPNSGQHQAPPSSEDREYWDNYFLEAGDPIAEGTFQDWDDPAYYDNFFQNQFGPPRDGGEFDGPREDFADLDSFGDDFWGGYFQVQGPQGFDPKEFAGEFGASTEDAWGLHFENNKDEFKTDDWGGFFQEFKGQDDWQNLGFDPSEFGFSDDDITAFQFYEDDKFMDNSQWANHNRFQDQYNDWGQNDAWSNFRFEGDKFIGAGGEEFRVTDFGYMEDDFGHAYDQSGRQFTRSEDHFRNQNGESGPRRPAKDKFVDFFQGDDGAEYGSWDGQFIPYDSSQGKFEHRFGGADGRDFEMNSEFPFMAESFATDLWNDHFMGFQDHNFDEFQKEDAYSWDNWGSNQGYQNENWWSEPMEPEQFQSRFGGLAEDMGRFEEFGKTWERQSGEFDHYFDDFKHKSDLNTKRSARIDTFGWDAEGAKSRFAFVDDVYADMKEGAAELEFLGSLRTQDFTSLNAGLSGLGSDSPAGLLEATAVGAEKLEVYDHAFSGIDAVMSGNTQIAPLGEIKQEFARVEIAYKEAGYDMPQSVQDILESVEGDIDTISELKDEMKLAYEPVRDKIKEVRASTDPDEVQLLKEDVIEITDEILTIQDDLALVVDEFWSSDPWVTVDDLVQNAHSLAQIGNTTQEMTGIKASIESAMDFVEVIKDLNPTEEHITFAINTANDLAEEGVAAIEAMESLVEDGYLAEDPGKLQEFWFVMDDLGRAAEKAFEPMLKYAAKNSDEVAALGEVAVETVETVQSDFEREDRERDHLDLYYDQFGFEEYSDFDEYGNFGSKGEFDEARFALADSFEDVAFDSNVDFDALVAQISADVIDDITRFVPERIMEEVALNIDSADVISAMLNNVDLIKPANLETTVSVVNIASKIDFATDVDSDVEDELEELEQLYTETTNTLVPKTLGDEFEDAWVQAKVYMEADPSAEELQEVIDELEDLFIERDEFMVEEGLRFEDVPSVVGDSPEWYSEPITQARVLGLMSGDTDTDGNPLGTARPADPVNYAEVLKMASEAAGHGESSGTPSDPDAQGQWFDGYVKTAENEGWDEFLDRASESGWGAECPREDVARLIGESFGLAEAEHEGVFNDVPSSHPDAGMIETMYEYGIFTGSGGSGDFDPEAPINRAATAAVISRAVTGDAGAVTTFREDSQEFVDNVEGLVEEVDSSTTDETETVGFIDFLRNLFSSILSF